MNINDADFRKVIYLALFGPGSRRNVGVLAEKIEEVEEHLVEIDERTKNQGSSLALMKNKVVGLECETYKNKYLLKNVPIKGANPGASRETFEETQKSVTEILRAAEMNLNSTDDFFRLYPKKGQKNMRQSANQNGAKPKTANIFIKFSYLYVFIHNINLLDFLCIIIKRYLIYDIYSNGYYDTIHRVKV